jgi:outer membrane protein assembly factor BamB
MGAEGASRYAFPMVRRAVALVVAALLSVLVASLGGETLAAQAQVATPTPTSTPTPTRTETPTTTPTPTVTATSTPGPWPMFQHDPRRTGRSQFPGPARVGRLWSYVTGVAPLTGSPIVGPDGTVYVGGGGYLHAIEAIGTPSWRLPVGTSFGTVLQAGDGTLYVTGATGTTNTLYRVTLDGTVLSRFTVTGSFISPLALALADDGTVYFGVGNSQGTGGILYAVAPNRLTGVLTERWRFTTGFLAGSQPAVDPVNGLVYFGSYDVNGSLYAVTPAGALLWRTEALGYVNSSPSIDTDGTIYIGAGTGLYAITPNGLVRWVYRTGVPINYSSPSIDIDGTIYVGAGDALLAVDRLGNLRWRQSCLPGGRVNSSPAISSDGLIYYQAILPDGVPSAALCATDSSGVIRWAHQTQYNGQNGPQVSSPAIGASDVVYVGSPDGVVIALVPAPIDPSARLRLPFMLR